MHKTRPVLTTLLVSLVLLPLGSEALLAQAVSGTVKYEGEPFRVRAIRMSADPTCEQVNEGERVTAQDRVVSDDGAVANAFVYLKEKPTGYTAATPEEPVVLGQKGCMYSPRVLGIQVNQTLRITNSDPTLHNVRCLAEENRPFNIGQPPDVPPREKVFRTVEKAVKFKCDVHPWMEAWIFVLDHPFFAVTDADGEFSIPDVPAGTYTLVAWHESFGEKETEIEVGADGASTAFVFE